MKDAASTAGKQKYYQENNMLKCNKSNICNEKRCKHHKKHKELFNSLKTSLCIEGYCITLKIDAKCAEAETCPKKIGT